MAGRPKIFDENQAIEKATEVFRNKGYDTASADELLNAMGIGKGSFYLAFKGGKQELYVKSIEQFSESFYKKLSDGIKNSENGIEYIKQFFLSQAYSPDCEKERGCFLGNSLVQLSEKDAQIKKTSVKILKKLHHLFVEVIEKAQENNQIETRENPEILAWHLTNLWNGIHVTRRMESSAEILKNMIELNLRLLN
ncbi:TetR/AcrR family transcriptional regulator [Chryseobacterium chendengshani]|uniref:TetR/AcrR family transcriptional regulator n=1 Tax=Chryseobacterium sp. LJ668 TaxID=2864040 RepID=UPI001C68B664|nr:TetR/AcrR family transcriptional regulator [Chryseobacterium sp. LJ668]MBW8523251.1 TetR/AcrR family transcriptional regulator [Chryseobacterium sp. LJ668]QYK15544.1 TetR/AcrR family transcriptional regulator [Chryseobacterium sp. LJ668]